MRQKHFLQRSPKRVWTKTYKEIRGFRVYPPGTHTNWRNWVYHNL